MGTALLEDLHMLTDACDPATHNSLVSKESNEPGFHFMLTDFDEITDAAPSLRAFKGAAHFFFARHLERVAVLQRASITSEGVVVLKMQFFFL